MKRAQHKNEIMNKVLEVSKDLFIRQGYAGTKIQQIVSGAGITTGSLYHFFRSKEDILSHLARDVFHKAAELADAFPGTANDPCLGFSLEIAGQLHFAMKYREISELYLVAYGSSLISGLIVEMAAERNRTLFERYNPAFTREDFYARSLAVKGILHSFIDEFVHYDRLEQGRRIDSVLELTLSLFHVPREEIRAAIARVNGIIESTSISVYGFRS